jgi:hypothetical protein
MRTPAKCPVKFLVNDYYQNPMLRKKIPSKCGSFLAISFFDNAGYVFQTTNLASHPFQKRGKFDHVNERFQNETNEENPNGNKLCINNKSIQYKSNIIICKIMEYEK